MNPVQYYETTIQDNDSNLAARVIVIPRRSLPEPDVEITGSMEYRQLNENEYIMQQLGLRPIKRIKPDQIATVLSAILSHVPELWGSIYDTSYEAARVYHVERILANPDDPRIPLGDREFASYLTSKPIIPFEESPLDALSLEHITKASGVSIGAYVGFVVAGATPLLFITVPAGMILCGAASGIGLGLQTGLQDRINRLIGRVFKREKRTSKKKRSAKKSRK